MRPFATRLAYDPSPHRPHTPRLRTQRLAGAALLLFTTALLGACGGGGAGAPPPPPEGAPVNLAYSATPVLYRAESAITPNTVSYEGDPVTTWDCTPPLPDGLSLNADGSISGAPTSPVPATNYTVTATNPISQGSVVVNIEVRWPEARSLAPKDDPTDADLRHFLDRTHFGFSQAHYNQIHQFGFANFVNGMTTAINTGGLEAAAHAEYLTDDDDPAGEFPSSTDIARWWTALMMRNPNPFQENLGFKLHDHFATSTEVLSSASRHFYMDHINMWRKGCFGNLRTLLINMTRDPAMLVWLSGIDNRDSAPNENFAREFFELFCLGVNIEYTQQDIVEAARAFTGYRKRYNEDTNKDYIEFDHNRHDEDEKVILGQTIPAQAEGPTETDDYEAMVDIVLSTNEAGTGVSRVGQWIMRSLLEYYCYPNPPQSVIDELANQLRDANWELKPVLMTMLRSEAFFSDAAREKFVKGPVDHILGFIRTTELSTDPKNVDYRLAEMEHRPSQPPTVDGWDGGTQWLSAQAMVQRANMIHYVVEVSRTFQSDAGKTALQLLPAVDADAGATVDTLAERLNVTMTPTERTEYVAFLDTERNSSGDVIDDPFDPEGNARDAEDRVRGLLWLLAQHPSYQIR